jgi:hypothetical protein
VISIAGGPAPLIATALLARFGSGYAVALYILFCAVVSIEKADFPDYDSGSDGPKAADELLARNGERAWRAVRLLLRGQRQALHSKIAGILEGDFPDLIEAQPQTLAHHFTEAGRFEKAICYWWRAGQQSTAKWALVEAIGQLRRGLQLIESLPSTPERKAQELELQVALASALRLARGYAHPEVPEVLSRSRSLILETGLAATPSHFTVLFALWSAHYTAGKAAIALERAEEFFAVAQSHTDAGHLCVGHRLLGATQIMTGDFPRALSNLEYAAALYKPEEHRRLAVQFGQDIGASAFCSLSLALWHTGHPDRGSHAAYEALRHARQSSHVHTLADALIYTGITAASERRVALTEERTDEALALAKEHVSLSAAAFQVSAPTTRLYISRIGFR